MLAPTPDIYSSAPDKVTFPGWKRMPGCRLYQHGKLERKHIDALWQQTGCKCLLKEFKPHQHRQLRIWGPPELHGEAFLCADWTIRRGMQLPLLDFRRVSSSTESKRKGADNSDARKILKLPSDPSFKNQMPPPPCPPPMPIWKGNNIGGQPMTECEMMAVNHLWSLETQAESQWTSQWDTLNWASWKASEPARTPEPTMWPCSNYNSSEDSEHGNKSAWLEAPQFSETCAKRTPCAKRQAWNSDLQPWMTEKQDVDQREATISDLLDSLEEVTWPPPQAPAETGLKAKCPPGSRPKVYQRVMQGVAPGSQPKCKQRLGDAIPSQPPGETPAKVPPASLPKCPQTPGTTLQHLPGGDRNVICMILEHKPVARPASAPPGKPTTLPPWRTVGQGCCGLPCVELAKHPAYIHILPVQTAARAPQVKAPPGKTGKPPPQGSWVTGVLAGGMAGQTGKPPPVKGPPPAKAPPPVKAQMPQPVLLTRRAPENLSDETECQDAPFNNQPE
jgi:hypothetical protein